jgi:hypothetical protein
MFGVPPLGGYAAKPLVRVKAELQTKLRTRTVPRRVRYLGLKLASALEWDEVWSLAQASLSVSLSAWKWV